jgi:DNA-binding NarL/FixJ family response regulator
LIILTLASANLNDSEKRNKTFVKAIALAEPRNLVLSLRMLGAHLDDLLETCPLTDTQRNYLLNNVMTTSRTGQIPDPRDLLTRREVEILQQVCTYKTNKEIGTKLYISEKTVKRHIANIYQKLQIKNRNEAIRLLSIEQDEVVQDKLHQ